MKKSKMGRGSKSIPKAPKVQKYPEIWQMSYSDYYAEMEDISTALEIRLAEILGNISLDAIVILHPCGRSEVYCTGFKNFIEYELFSHNRKFMAKSKNTWTFIGEIK